MANTWNKSGTTWGYNSWQSDTVTQSLTGQSATSSIGSLEAANEEGWGRQEFGNSGWGVEYSVSLTAPSTLTSSVGSAEVQLLQILTAPSGLTSSVGSIVTGIGIPLTGVGATSSVGSLTEVSTNAGWGRDTWGQEPWGDTDEPVITLTGLGLTSSIGSVSAYNEQGWGRDPWGYENWGESAMTVIVDVSSSGVATASVGAIAPTEMSIGLTGLGLTSSLGTPGLVYGPVDLLTAPATLTSSVGSLSPDDMAIGLTGLSVTASVGAIAPADVMGLTGVSATASLGDLTITQTVIVSVTAPSTLTSSVGAIVPEIGVPLTGLSATVSVGAITPADVMGLTGVSATASVGNPAPIAWGKITAEQTGNWSKKTATQSGNWTRKTS